MWTHADRGRVDVINGWPLISKLTSSALPRPMDRIDCPASLCTSDVCKEGTIKF